MVLELGQSHNAFLVGTLWLPVLSVIKWRMALMPAI